MKGNWGTFLPTALAGVLLVFFRGGTVEFPFVFLALLLVLVPAILHARALLRDARDRVFLLAVCGVVCWVLLAQQFSIAFEISIGATLSVLVACGAAVVARGLHRSGQAMPLLWVLAAASGAAALWAGARIHFEGIDPYAFRDRNVLADGVFLAVLAVLAEALRAAGGRSAVRAAWLGAGALLLGAVLVTSLLGARVGWLMLFLAAVILALAEGRGEAGRRLFWLWPIAVLVALAVDPVLQAFAAPTAHPGGGSGDGVGKSLFIRTTLLSAAVDLLGERPLFGAGLLTFFLRFEPMQDPAFFHGGGMVHNDYLQVALALGWPAGLALLALAGRVLFDWVHALRKRRAGDAALRSRVLLLAALGVFGHALLNFPLHDAHLLVLLAVVLATGLAGDATGLAEPRGEAAPRPGAFGIIAGVTLLACLAQTVQAAAVAVDAVALRSHPPAPGLTAPRLSVETVAGLASRLRALPYGNPAFQEGRILADRWEASGRSDPSLVAGAIEAFEEARRRSPHVSEYAIQHARLLRETGRPLAERRAVLDAQLATRPKDARLWLSLAVHTLQAGQLEEAVVVARQGWLPWCAHGLFRTQETRDLITLALQGEGDPAPLSSCLRRLDARGIRPTTLEDLRRRFPLRGPPATGHS